MTIKETPQQYEARQARAALKTTKEYLPTEMWFGIGYQTVGLVFAAIGIIQFFTWTDKGPLGWMLAAFLVFANSTYWAWYIRRGLNRRWEKEMLGRLAAEKRADSAFQAPPEQLLSRAPEGPKKSF